MTADNTEPPGIYLAGPDVFLPDALAAGARKAELCRLHGFAGLFPLDTRPPPGPDQALEIYRANIGRMHRAAAGIFNLTPFRGPSADPGTVFELGFMAALGKPVFGYTNAASDLRTRTGGARQDASGAWFTPDGLAVEDFGNADNLMIDECLRDAGYPVIRMDAGGKLDALDGFTACLNLARQVLGPSASRNR